MLDHTHVGRPLRLLNVLDEYTRECLTIQVARQFRATDVQACLTELFCQHGVPKHVRSDNGQEFIAEVVRRWLGELGSQPLFIAQLAVERFLRWDSIAIAIFPRTARFDE